MNCLFIKHIDVFYLNIIYIYEHFCPSPNISRTTPSSYSTTTVTPRWCPCGFVAVWRREELSRLRDTSDVAPPRLHGPERFESWTLIKGFRAKYIQKYYSSDLLYTDKKITRCWMLYVSKPCIMYILFCDIEELTSAVLHIWLSASKKGNATSSLPFSGVHRNAVSVTAWRNVVEWFRFEQF